jgi:hypothetical protein
MDKVNVDILIAGGGSAGFGAAFKACLHSKGKFTVAVVEKNSFLGGTSTAGGVTAWEMGIGGPGIHTEIADRLLKLNNKAAILKVNWKPLSRTRPYALASPDDRYSYDDTLKAAGIFDRENNHNSFMFEPTAMSDIMEKSLKTASDGNLSVFFGETISEVILKNRRIHKVITDEYEFTPRMTIDCTGGALVSYLAGCGTEFGECNTGKAINGVTQVYRVEKKRYASIDKIPSGYLPPYNDPGFMERLEKVQVISSINEFPNGDLNINQLPTIDGDEFFALNPEEMKEKCTGRVFLHWRRMQEDVPFMRGYRIKTIYPMMGIRESRRLAGKHILTADDVISGFDKQNNKDSLIAFSDHPIDMHGKAHKGLTILEKPYGIPYQCLLPKEVDNLITACRGASFDSTAAASCRLSRTMIAIGEAAGTAAADCLDNKKSACEADINRIRAILGIDRFEESLYSEYIV